MSKKKKKRKGLLVGYARVSTLDQDQQMQTDALLEDGVDSRHLFEEKISARNANRPKLKEVLAFLEQGDVLFDFLPFISFCSCRSYSQWTAIFINKQVQQNSRALISMVDLLSASRGREKKSRQRPCVKSQHVLALNQPEAGHS